MEEFWAGYRGDDRDFYQGLIQAAVAPHHASVGNAGGAARRLDTLFQVLWP